MSRTFVIRRLWPRELLAVLLGAGVLLAGIGEIRAQATDLILSEYVEGSSNNKAIELYNGTAGELDLSSYSLSFYFNGNTSPQTTISLAGVLASGEVAVVADNNASADILGVADIISTSSFFNGDDGVVLFNGAVVVDSIGQLGTDPGSSWSPDTQNVTLRRLPEICVGDVDFGDVYDAALEWELFPQDEFSGLGVHTASCSGGADPAPTLLRSDPSNGASSIVADTAWVLTFSESVSVSAMGASLWCSDSGSVPLVLREVGSATYTFTPQSLLQAGETCELILTAGSVLDSAGQSLPAELRLSATVEAGALCGEPATAIHSVQGAGAVSPLEGQLVTIEGVVVADYQGEGQLGGFFIQEEDDQTDADPLTSEGVFVYTGGSSVAVQSGDVVRVQGVVSEYFELTEIADVASVTTCGAGLHVTPAAPTLPATNPNDWEAYEGMAVHFADPLFATESYNLGRYGQVLLSVGNRLYQPTHLVEPGASAQFAAADNQLSSILLDDGSTQQNPSPVPFLADDNSFRLGDSVTGLSAVLTYSFGEYQLVPRGSVSFLRANPRPQAPVKDYEGLTVASFNVLNYFTTIDDGSPVCGPDYNLDCRGADSASEFGRQRAKILDALVRMKADIVGLVELENTDSAAIADLVDGLNTLSGETYGFVNTGSIGTDAIRVGIIYNQAIVETVGNFAVLDSSVDPSFNDQKNRPVLAQTFRELSSNEVFTLAVNHLKSKGSACTADGDPDTGDGQGNCNLTRTAAATAEAAWLSADPTGSGDPDFLVVGDLNAYAKEDPIAALENAGFANLIEQFAGPYSYSYVFDGQFGYLDHALASESLSAQVVSVEEWHINSDESRIFDYNEEFNPAELYAPNAFRSSDHDPVIVTLDFMPTVPTCNGLPATVYVDREGLVHGGDQDGLAYYGLLTASGPAVIVGTDDEDVIVAGGGAVVVCALDGDDFVATGSQSDLIFAGSGRDLVIAGNGADVIHGEGGNDFIVAGSGADSLFGGEGNDTLIGGAGRDSCDGGAGRDRGFSCRTRSAIP